MYSEKVMEHFMKPRNVWYMPNHDGMGAIGDPGCGDNFKMFIQVRNDIIAKISFLVFGCGAAIACGSMTTVLAQGKKISDALKITEQDVIVALDGLPEAKQHCSNLGVVALQAAIQDYLVKHGRTMQDYM
ncbi:MAG: iron-sulfur cluster assembly scaffold protein [Negativicutes bacterium]|nr:iron-sulfur cluster assembly scaffold protein [Negativicutes bacterium]